MIWSQSFSIIFFVNIFLLSILIGKIIQKKHKISITNDSYNYGIAFSCMFTIMFVIFTINNLLHLNAIYYVIVFVITMSGFWMYTIVNRSFLKNAHINLKEFFLIIIFTIITAIVISVLKIHNKHITINTSDNKTLFPTWNKVIGHIKEKLNATQINPIFSNNLYLTSFIIPVAMLAFIQSIKKVSYISKIFILLIPVGLYFLLNIYMLNDKAIVIGLIPMIICQFIEFVKYPSRKNGLLIWILFSCAIFFSFTTIYLVVLSCIVLIIIAIVFKRFHLSVYTKWIGSLHIVALSLMLLQLEQNLLLFIFISLFIFIYVIFYFISFFHKLANVITTLIIKWRYILFGAFAITIWLYGIIYAYINNIKIEIKWFDDMSIWTNLYTYIGAIFIAISIIVLNKTNKINIPNSYNKLAGFVLTWMIFISNPIINVIWKPLDISLFCNYAWIIPMATLSILIIVEPIQKLFYKKKYKNHQL